MSTHTISHPPKPTTAGKKATAIATELKRLGILPFGDVLQRHMEKSSPKEPDTPLSPMIPVLGVIVDEETVVSVATDRILKALARAGHRKDFNAVAMTEGIYTPDHLKKVWRYYREEVRSGKEGGRGQP